MQRVMLLALVVRTAGIGFTTVADRQTLDGVHPKVIVLLAGTNNVGSFVPAEDLQATVADITGGISSSQRLTNFLTSIKKSAP